MKKSPSKYKIRFVVGSALHHKKYSTALAKGMKKHGFTDVQLNSFYNPDEKPDLVPFWAHKRLNIINGQKLNRKQYLVMERAYVSNRHHWVSLAYNGLNGRGNFCNSEITDMTRWNKYFKDYVKPWRVKKDGYALVIGQVMGDASHKHINIQKWYQNTILKLNEMGVPVVFRPHPLDTKSNYRPYGEYKTDIQGDLEQTLKGARTCITYNSNSGVISALAGVPTICHDIGSMAYDVSSVGDLENLDYTPDRSNWLAKLAYTQWLPEELEDGTAWDHLKVGLDYNAD